MFNIEKFHNYLALNLGYEHIVKNQRIHISVEESGNPWVTLKFDGYDDFRFKASDADVVTNLNVPSEIRKEIESIIDASHQAYLSSMNSQF